jgi:hypothetical protein
VRSFPEHCSSSGKHDAGSSRLGGKDIQEIVCKRVQGNPFPLLSKLLISLEAAIPLRGATQRFVSLESTRRRAHCVFAVS